MKTFQTALIGLSLAAGASALAQTATGLAQARDVYERAIAACNAGQLPAPQREACIRDAGLALDRARLGPGAPPEVTTTQDGRATVVPNVPPASTTQGGGSAGSAAGGGAGGAAGSAPDTVVSPDGRARVVVPTDGSVPARAP